MCELRNCNDSHFPAQGNGLNLWQISRSSPESFIDGYRPQLSLRTSRIVSEQTAVLQTVTFCENCVIMA